MQSISHVIAAELAVREPQVAAAIALLDEGATVPFVARYRKEVTGGLDDQQLRLLEERLGYLRDLASRRETILNSIRDQGKLTAELEAQIQTATTKTRLEDLYLPYKPKRRTKAQIAREAGLAPLAEALLVESAQMPETLAAAYVNAEQGFADAKAVLTGARHILMEQFAEDAELTASLRERLWDQGVVTACRAPEAGEMAAKFSDYFDFEQTIKTIPSHRALALFRGRNTGVLQLKLDLPAAEDAPHPALGMIARHVGVAAAGRAADDWLSETVRWTWQIKLHGRLETDLLNQLREQAEAEATDVFARNLRDLLLAAPGGTRAVIGLDPGLRTGVKVAVVDTTGRVCDTATIYPHPPRADWQGSLATLGALVAKHDVRLIAIGNGTAARDTERLARELAKVQPALQLQTVMVSEAGASVYSASALASEELPELDVSLRGAVSIARRLQDPLAELVKIDPKAIGVGQYQHDVNQTRLARTLDGVVEDCVNAVGVDINLASPALLARVAGLSNSLAHNIVTHRDSHGAFTNRRQLLKVSRLGAKAFEQCAGFLRIRDGDNPLDASAVHPEAYPVVERIVQQTACPVASLIGNQAVLRKLAPASFTDEAFGLPTVTDILSELEKPGRDPRPAFRTVTFREGVERLTDLAEGMQLEGVVTNVTNFGAFVDIGVHQDGLVHISQLAERYIKDPHSVVKPGDLVRVKVLEVDVERKRISLSMRLDEPAAGKPAEHQPRATRTQNSKNKGERAGNAGRNGQTQAAKPPEQANSVMADALSAALKDKAS